MKQLKLLSLLFILVFAVSIQVKAQIRHEIDLPDILGYQTLKCDFHMHTIFSDGYVWPTVRVDEAWAEGLDAIAITDHIEYLPHKQYIEVDHNRAYEIAKDYAERKNMILIQGTEITRNMPPGHLNAIFVKDANALETEKFEDIVKEAKHQDALVFWNHPGWEAQAPDSTRWYDMHTKLYEKNFFHGIEVANYNTWYPKAIKWCKEKALTVFGNSDMHQPSQTYQERNNLDRRVMTLVFAEERSGDAIKKALLDRRSVAWIKDDIIGQKKYVSALFKASIELISVYSDEESIRYRLSNQSDLNIILSGKNGTKITLEPEHSVLLNIKHEASKEYVVNNFITGMNEKLSFSVDQEGLNIQ